jgi:hypothetical protein
MTTFTTEDRLIAEQNGSVTINVEPIPFAGIITLTESAPKYRDLTDEEICKIFNEHTGLGIHQKEADKADLLVFARAILRKAKNG